MHYGLLMYTENKHRPDIDILRIRRSKFRKAAEMLVSKSAALRLLNIFKIGGY